MSYMTTVISNWSTTFRGFKFSTQEFYACVERQIKSREMPRVKVSRVTHKEGGMFSSSREYLRIECDDLAFDVCAAPFGVDFFVSWWFGNTSTIGKAVVGKVFGAKVAESKVTYFKLDTQAMFKESVRFAVMSAIDEISEAKGIRALSELDRNEVTMA